MQITNERDFWAGLLFIAFGLTFAIGAQNYEMGTAQRMGPAYFPTILGGLLALLGLYIASRGLRSRFAGADGQIERFHFRPLVLVVGAVVLFAVMLRPLGLVIALATMIVVGAAAGPHFRLREVIVIAVVLVAMVMLIFIYALGLTIPVWPAFVAR